MVPIFVHLFFQDLAIEITDRDPADHPQGIPYKILAEACSPGINLVDLASIFEEHRVVKNLSVFLNSHQLELDGGGVYGEDENKFIFGHVLVGRKVKARFKISNANKVRVCGKLMNTLNSLAHYWKALVRHVTVHSVNINKLIYK